MNRDYLLRARVSSAIGKMLCANPTVSHMEPEHIAAMHVFKHEVMAAFHRVYLTVPSKFADPLIGDFLRVLPALFEAEDDENPQE